MFQKSLQQSQMIFTVLSASIYFVPEVSVLQLELMKILIQEYAYAYPAVIPASNEYLM